MNLSTGASLLALAKSIYYLLQSIALLNDQKNSLRSERDEAFHGALFVICNGDSSKESLHGKQEIV